MFTIEDKIEKHLESDIDKDCGPLRPGARPPAGACTKVQAILMCHCECSESGWKAIADLRLYGDMYVFNGQWPYDGRQPRDQKVQDLNSAIDHEYRAHIDPAVQAVTGTIKKLESKTFKSKAECEKGCKDATKKVHSQFNASLAESMREEGMQ